LSTTVVWHPACRKHYGGAGHPERPQRIEAVLEALRRPEMVSVGQWVEAVPAERAALERVHPAAYLDRLEAMAAHGGGALDPDTFLGPSSWESVLASAAVALTAVERGLAAGTHRLTELAEDQHHLQRVLRQGVEGREFLSLIVFDLNNHPRCASPSKSVTKLSLACDASEFFLSSPAVSHSPAPHCPNPIFDRVCHK